MRVNNAMIIDTKHNQGSEMPKLQNFTDAIITLQTPSSAYHHTMSALRFLQSCDGDEKSLGNKNYRRINQLIMDNILQIITNEDSSLDPRKHQVVRTECFLMLSNILESKINFEAPKSSHSSSSSEPVLKMKNDNFVGSYPKTIKPNTNGLQTNANTDQSDVFNTLAICDGKFNGEKNNENCQKMHLPAIMKKNEKKKAPSSGYLVKNDAKIDITWTTVRAKRFDYSVGIDDKNREEQVESSSLSVFKTLSLSFSLSLLLSLSLSLFTYIYIYVYMYLYLLSFSLSLSLSLSISLFLSLCFTPLLSLTPLLYTSLITSLLLFFISFLHSRN